MAGLVLSFINRIRKISEMRKILLSILISLILFTCILWSFGNDDRESYQYNQKGVTALENKDYEMAISQLRAALEHSPDNEIIKKNLAAAYNNYALELADGGELDRALEYLGLAFELGPHEKTYPVNISQVLLKKGYQYYQQRDFEEALEYLRQSVNYDPDNLNALALLGDIYYYTQEMEKALIYWERALEINPELKPLQEKLSNLKKELKVEGSFGEVPAHHFDIRFEQGHQEDYVYDIRDYLGEAYRDIGQDFNYFPERKIVVIIYREETFRTLREKTPEWLIGLYDGKIRLPLFARSKSLKETEFKKLVWHEYTHALLHDLTLGNCPAWLNEGLAKYEESKQGELSLEELEKVLRKKKGFLPLEELSMTLRDSKDIQKIMLAYEESFTLVSYIIDRYGLWAVNRLLEGLRDGQKIEEAIKKELHLSIKQLEDRWKDYLE